MTVVAKEPGVPSPRFVYYPLDDGGLVTTIDAARVTRSQLVGAQNSWLEPKGVVTRRPGIGNLGGGAITGTGTTGSTGQTPTTPFLGCAVVRFNNVSYVIVQDNNGFLFAFPKYTGNTAWYGIIGVGGTTSLSNSVGQLYDPTIAEPACFFGGCQPNVATPTEWTGVTTTFSANTTAGANTVITPTGLSGMNGIYVGAVMRLSENTANFESGGAGLTVSAVTATTFTVPTTAHNHSIGDKIAAITVTPATLPRRFDINANITARFSETLFSNLFYSGEVSSPTAVYTSDPYFPQSFTSNYFQSTIYPGTYQPALIGHNDGVNGGDATGVRRLGDAMIVYKQSAIYRLSLTSLYGDMVWRVEIVSPSIGCTDFNSIVSFDGFHAFKGVDGVYKTSGTAGEMPQKVSGNVGTFFDPAACVYDVNGNRAAPVATNNGTATACRFGSKYMLFYDGSGGGFPDRGMWFDFENLGTTGLPKAGELRFHASVGGCAGVAAMRGPADTGTFAFVSHTNNLVGEFGQAGIAAQDFGFNCPFSLTLKGDLIDDFPLPNGGAAATQKPVERITMIAAIPSGSLVNTLGLTGYPAIAALAVANSGATNPPQFVSASPGEITASLVRNRVQITMSESSPNQFTIYGFLAELAVEEPLLT